MQHDQDAVYEASHWVPDRRCAASGMTSKNDSARTCDCL